MQYRYITIEGNIGAGKTSLATMLAKKMGARLVLEQFADNPFIAKFYENPEKFAFPFELFFVAERFQQLSEMTAQQDFFFNGVITDYLFIKSQLFSKVNLTDDEFKLYNRIFDIIYKTLPAPDLIVYLHCSIENLQKKIKIRGREYEQNIKDEYLENIEAQYFSLFKNLKNSRILILDINQLDFVNNPHHFEIIEEVINRDYDNKLNYITLE
jgi:deoxyadenosine/deoxycytidine kinase